MLAGSLGMVTVTEVMRRSNALGSSGLRCLAGVASVNVSVGCAHGCVYCYTQGYRQFPGRDKVEVYSNTADKVLAELGRKRKLPKVVYFCPSCDAFQPVKEVLEQSLRTMRCLLDYGVGVQFVTKGMVPKEFLALFRCHRGLVSAQVGLTCVNDDIAAVLEPGAPRVRDRLDTVGRLQDSGVKVGVRADPLIHGYTDSDNELDDLIAACARIEVKEIAASYLFLRPAVRSGLLRGLGDEALVERILRPYAEGVTVAIQGSRSCGWGLPVEIRRGGYERLRKRCEAQGIKLHLCGCKNADLTEDRCHLVRKGWPGGAEMMDLFSEEPGE